MGNYYKVKINPVKNPCVDCNEEVIEDFSYEGMIKGTKLCHPCWLSRVDNYNFTLDSKVDDLGLSERTINAFRGMGISKLGHIFLFSESDFLGWRNFGTKSLEELRTKMIELQMPLDKFSLTLDERQEYTNDFGFQKLVDVIYKCNEKKSFKYKDYEQNLELQ